MATHIVSSAAELTQALATAQGGDRIELEAGDYGDVFLRNLDFGTNVVITGHDGAVPEFGTLRLVDTHHITFDGIKVDFEPDMDTLEFSSAFRADNASHISILNSVFTGGDAVDGVPADSEEGTQGHKGIEGYPIGTAAGFFRSDNITLENNVISEFTAGIRFTAVDEINITNNEIFNVRKVPVGGGEVSNVVMESNYFHDMIPWSFSALGDHSDYVHFWTQPDQDGPSENFIFRDNYFAQGDGVGVLGFYLDDNHFEKGFSNVLVENNVLHTGHRQGILMEDVDGLTIINNTLLQSSGAENDAPSIEIAEGNTNVIIDQNIMARIYGRGLDDLEADNIVIGDNLNVQSYDANAPDFAGNFIINPLTGLPTLEDLHVIPGTLPSEYGATLGELPSSYITDDIGEGLEVNQHSFALNTDTAGQVVWEFGDGQQVEGAEVTHTYNAPGLYEVVATVTLPDNSTYQVAKVVEVISPAAVHQTFEDGFVVGEGMSLEEDGTNTALRLDEARATYKVDTDEGLDNHDAYTVSVSFKRDEGSETDSARILHFAGTAVINLDENGITLRGATDAGETILLRAASTDIQDSEWHQITYTYDQETGSAILYLDGTELTRMDGLTGGQYIHPYQDFHLGNPFGENFTGVLDNAVFLRGALDTEQVQQEYQNLVDGSPVFDFGDQAPAPAPEVPETEAPAPAPEVPDPEVPETEAPAPAAPEAPASGTPALAPDTVKQEIYVQPDRSPVINLEVSGPSKQVSREEVIGILEEEAFEISMTLQADSTESAGEVVRLHHSFLLNITEEGEIRLDTFSHDDEWLTLRTEGANINDMDSHDITLTRSHGILEIHVDGQVLASAEMLWPLTDRGNHNLVFGNQFDKQNFEGELSNFEMHVVEESILTARFDIQPSNDLDTLSVFSSEAYQPVAADQQVDRLGYSMNNSDNYFE